MGSGLNVTVFLINHTACMQTVRRLPCGSCYEMNLNALDGIMARILREGNV